MRRAAVLGSLLVALLIGLVAVGAVAQEGTPPADEFELPEGVTFEGLAFGLAEALPPGPVGLGLFRATLEPGASIDLDPDPSYFMVFVESGTITFHVDAPTLVTRAVAGTPAAQTFGPEAAPEEMAANTDVTLAQGMPRSSCRTPEAHPARRATTGRRRPWSWSWRRSRRRRGPRPRGRHAGAVTGHSSRQAPRRGAASKGRPRPFPCPEPKPQAV